MSAPLFKDDALMAFAVVMTATYRPALHRRTALAALVSLMSDRTVPSDTAMTGEISLRGLVLPVGGIKEKVISAARAGLKRVMLPARNKKDYEDIPPGSARPTRIHLA